MLRAHAETGERLLLVDHLVALAHEELAEDQELFPVELNVAVYDGARSVAQACKLEVAQNFSLHV